MSKQTAVTLPDDTHKRLSALAARTGRPVTLYIREAIEAHLEELEDVYLAEQELERLKRGEGQTYSIGEVERRLGLDD